MASDTGKQAGLMETMTAQEWLNSRQSGDGGKRPDDQAPAGPADAAMLPQPTEIAGGNAVASQPQMASQAASQTGPAKFTQTFPTKKQDVVAGSSMKNINQQKDVAPTAQAFLNSIDQFVDDDNRQDGEGESFQAVRPELTEFKPAPGFGARDMAAAPAMVGSRRKSRLIEKAVRAPLEGPAATGMAAAAPEAPVEEVASGARADVVPVQVATPERPSPSTSPADVGMSVPKVHSASQDSAASLLPVQQADLQALSERLDRKLAEISRSVQDLHIASEENRVALTALREERAAMSLPAAEPLRVVATPASHQAMPAQAMAVAEPVASVEAVPAAIQPAASTMNAAARMHAANANAVTRRQIPAFVWLVIAALAIGVLLMMVAPGRVLVQKLGDPATYSTAGSRLGQGMGSLNTGISLLSDRIRGLVVE